MAPRCLSCFLLWVSLVAGCSPAESPGPSSKSSGRNPFVVNGQTDPGHPSAGLLVVGNGLCTATLIGKKTVLTAAHCVEPGYTHTFEVGGAKYQSVSVQRHPGFNTHTDDDVAVVRLASEPSVQPAAVNITVPAVGLEITIVGFGKTSEWASDVGVKRMAKARIDQVTSNRIRMPPSQSDSDGNVCNGDSGGPSYALINGQEVQVGVHSTKAGACGDGGHDMRVDTYISWISQSSSGDVVTPGGTAPPPDPTPSPNPNPKQTPDPSPPPDSTAPTVSITYPPAGARVPTSLTVASQIRDNVGVTRIELRSDGQVVASNSGASQNFPLVLAPGRHLLQVTAWDAANNKGEATVEITADANQPASPSPSPAPAPAKGSFGESCQSEADCSSGLCADDLSLKRKYCTQSCNSTNPCPGAAECFTTSDNRRQVCALATGGNAGAGGKGAAPGTGSRDDLLGSCSTAPGGPASAPWLLLLVILLLRRRRRRAWSILHDCSQHSTGSAGCRSAHP